MVTDRGGFSWTEVRVCAVFVTRDSVFSLSLCSSLRLTYQFPTRRFASRPQYLIAILPHLAYRGEVHWYDFAADHEVKGGMQRTKEFIRKVVEGQGKGVEFLSAGKAGARTIAKRQFRVVVDFRVV